MTVIHAIGILYLETETTEYQHYIVQDCTILKLFLISPSSRIIHTYQFTPISDPTPNYGNKSTTASLFLQETVKPQIQLSPLNFKILRNLEIFNHLSEKQLSSTTKKLKESNGQWCLSRYPIQSTSIQYNVIMSTPAWKPFISSFNNQWGRRTTEVIIGWKEDPN